MNTVQITAEAAWIAVELFDLAMDELRNFPDEDSERRLEDYKAAKHTILNGISGAGA